MLNYQEKYFKYKKKYLKLTGGNRFELSGGAPRDYINDFITYFGSTLTEIENMTEIENIKKFLKSKISNLTSISNLEEDDIVKDNNNGITYIVKKKRYGCDNLIGIMITYNLVYDSKEQPLPLDVTKIVDEIRPYTIEINPNDRKKYTISSIEKNESTEITKGDIINIQDDHGNLKRIEVEDVNVEIGKINVSFADEYTSDIYTSKPVYQIYDIEVFIKSFLENKKRNEYIENIEKNFSMSKNKEALEEIFKKPLIIDIINKLFENINSKIAIGNNERHRVSIHIIDHMCINEHPFNQNVDIITNLSNKSMITLYILYIPKSDKHKKTNIDIYEISISVLVGKSYLHFDLDVINETDDIKEKYYEKIYNAFIEKLLHIKDKHRI